MIIHHSDSVASAFPVAGRCPKQTPKTRFELWASLIKTLKACSYIFPIHLPVKKKLLLVCQSCRNLQSLCCMFWGTFFFNNLGCSIYYVHLLVCVVTNYAEQSGQECFPLSHEHFCVSQRLLGMVEPSHMLWCSVTLIAVEAASEMISATYSEVFVKFCCVNPREQSVWISQEMVTSE